MIGGAQRSQIAAACAAGRDQVGMLTPRKDVLAMVHGQNVTKQSSVTPISVRPRMDRHEAVMNAHRNLVDREGLVCKPVSRVVEEIARRTRELVNRQTEIALRNTKLSRPSPGTIEHLTM